MCRRIYTQEEQKNIRIFKNWNKDVVNCKCHYCGKILTESSMTVDHLMPYSLGGETVSSNLVVACKECNIEKSDMTESEYNTYRETKSNNIAKDETINTIKRMLLANNSIDIKFNETVKQVSSKTLEKNEILKCIKDIKFSASQGYQLCSELKDCMIEISSLSKTLTNLKKLKDACMSSNMKLETVRDDLIDGITKNLRSGMKLGHRSLKAS